MAAFEIIDGILDIMNRDEIAISTFMDLSKAFDTIDHHIMLSKLKFYSLDNIAPAPISSYLQNRSQQVLYNLPMYPFRSETISTEVPQDSILGPLLFLIYINPLNAKLATQLYQWGTSQQRGLEMAWRDRILRVGHN